jgi:hypothetical protein
MRFVAVKTEEQQARAMLFRIRDLLVRERTQLINALRGQLSEHGLVVPQGPANLKGLAEAIGSETTSLPLLVVELSCGHRHIRQEEAPSPRRCRLAKPLNLLDQSLAERQVVSSKTVDVRMRSRVPTTSAVCATRDVGATETPLMTRADHDAIGGVEGALAKRPQAIFEDATKNETDTSTVALFRRLCTRLVTLGEGSEDTRRIVGRDELGQREWALAKG